MTILKIMQSKRVIVSYMWMWNEKGSSLQKQQKKIQEDKLNSKLKSSLDEKALLKQRLEFGVRSAEGDHLREISLI